LLCISPSGTPFHPSRNSLLSSTLVDSLTLLCPPQVSRFTRRGTHCSLLHWWTHSLCSASPPQVPRFTRRGTHGDAQHLDGYGVHSVSAQRRHTARVQVRSRSYQAEQAISLCADAGDPYSTTPHPPGAARLGRILASLFPVQLVQI
jgi:hypothetical protein